MASPTIQLQAGTLYASNDASWFTGTGGPYGWSPWTAEFGGVVTSAGLDAEPFADVVYQVASGDEVTFVIAVQNRGGAAAYDVRLRATLPQGFTQPADMNLTVTDGANTDLAFTGDLFSTAGLRVTPSIAAYSATGGNNVVLLTYTLLATNTLPGPEADVPEVVTLLNVAASPGGANLAQAATASTDVITAAPTVTVAAESDPSAVAKGQTVAFDVTIGLPAGTVPGLTLSTLLPAGSSQLSFVSASIVHTGTGLTLGTPTTDSAGTVSLGTVTASAASGADDTLTVRVLVRADGSASGAATLRSLVQSSTGWSAEADSAVGVVVAPAPPTVSGFWASQWTVTGRAVHPLAGVVLGGTAAQTGTLAITLQDGGTGRLSGVSGGSLDSTGHTFVLSGTFAVLQAAVQALVLTPGLGTATLSVTVMNAQGGVAQDSSTQVTAAAGPVSQVPAGPLTVAGSFSLLSFSGPLAVSNASGTSGLVVQAGATLAFAATPDATRTMLEVAGTAGSTGTVAVAGSSSVLDLGGNAAGVGNGGTGALLVSGGAMARLGTADSRVRPALLMGDATGAVASLVVTGAGSTVAAAGLVSVGRGGAATLTLDQGASLTGGSAASGDGTGASAAFGIAIGDGTPATGATLYFRGSGTAHVSNASILHSRADLLVGTRGGTGTLTLDGASLAWADASIVAGSAVDRAGASGTVSVAGGSTLRSGGRRQTGVDEVAIGRGGGTSGSVSVDGAGSLLDANGGRVALGTGGTGTLSVSGGGTVRAGASYTDTEAALAVGALAGGVGSVSLGGTGSQVLVAGQTVLGGTNRGGGTVAGGIGTLSVGGGLFRTTGLSLFQGSSLSVGAAGTAVVGTGAGTAGLLTVDAGATLSGGGAVHATVRNNGTVTALAGVLALDTVDAQGTGVLAVQGGELDVTSFAGHALSFGPQFSVMRLGITGAGAVSVTGFAFGDVLDIAQTGLAVGGSSVTAGSTVLTFYGLAWGTHPVLTADGRGGAAITMPDPLFDAAFYLSTNPDIARAGVDPYTHYTTMGWREGRQPSLLFDPAFYLRHGPDIATAGVNPLDHFETFGWAEQRSPSAAFDTQYYVAQNPDILAAHIDPLVHFIVSGAAEGRNPNAFFDMHYYLTQNPDVAQAGMDPLIHFLTFGWREGRPPSLLFDLGKYSSTYADVAASGADPLVSYLDTGRFQGRMAFLTGGTAAADPLVDTGFYDRQLGATLIPSGPAGAQQAAWSYDTSGWTLGLNPDPWFDTKYYLSHNPDVAAAHVDPLWHYEAFGWREGRDPSAQFSTRSYLAANPDVARATMNPLLHYVQNGQYEGRSIFPA